MIEKEHLVKTLIVIFYETQEDGEFAKQNHRNIIGGFAVGHAVLKRNILEQAIMVFMVCKKI